MTSKQNELIKTINCFIKENGYSPTIRELCETLGVSSPATIHSRLKVLKRKKIITYVEGKSRTIKILNENID